MTRLSLAIAASILLSAASAMARYVGYNAEIVSVGATGVASYVTYTNSAKITGKLVAVNAYSIPASTVTVSSVTGVGSIASKTVLSAHPVTSAGLTTNIATAVYLVEDRLVFSATRGASTNDGNVYLMLIVEE